MKRSGKLSADFPRQKDFNLQQAQATILKAGFTMISAIRDHLTQEKQQVTKVLTDALRLIIVVFRNLTAHRQELIAIELPARFKTLATKEVESNAFLFGDNLTSSIKEINTTNALTSKWKGSSHDRRPFHPYRGRVGFSQRGRGGYNRYNYRQPFLGRRGSSRGWGANTKAT